MFLQSVLFKCMVVTLVTLVMFTWVSVVLPLMINQSSHGRHDFVANVTNNTFAFRSVNDISWLDVHAWFNLEIWVGISYKERSTLVQMLLKITARWRFGYILYTLDCCPSWSQHLSQWSHSCILKCHIRCHTCVTLCHKCS